MSLIIRGEWGDKMGGSRHLLESVVVMDRCPDNLLQLPLIKVLRGQHQQQLITHDGTSTRQARGNTDEW